MRLLPVITSFVIAFAACGQPEECTKIPLGTNWSDVNQPVKNTVAFSIDPAPDRAQAGRMSTLPDGGVGLPRPVGGKYSNGNCAGYGSVEYGQWACWAWVEDEKVVGLAVSCGN